MEPVLATYRLQLHRGFTLATARALVPYLARLGVTHVYASPMLRARAGSTHGYDVVDPTMLNPELGDERALKELVADLRHHGMGLVLDIVPNHMAAVFENARWEEVLIAGRTSPHARWFDIDWRAPDREFHARVMLPVLDAPRRQLLEQGAIQLEWMGDQFRAAYGPQRFPLDPASIGPVLRLAAERLRVVATSADEAATLTRLADGVDAMPGSMARGRQARHKRLELKSLTADLTALARESADVGDALRGAAAEFGAPPDGPARMAALLERQAYRLAHWRRAAREINYRRFFDINDLVSLHVENPAVFDETHALVLQWVGQGLLDGLRVDHVDGLRDPAAYLERLVEAIRARSEDTLPIFIEKILGHDEQLVPDWPVAGTTGYEFLNSGDALFIAPEGHRTIEAFYRRLVPMAADFAEVALRSKRKILGSSLSAPVYRLAQRLHRLATQWPGAGGLEARDFVETIVETIAHLRVYRTYMSSRAPDPSPADRAATEQAIAEVRQQGRVSSERVDVLEQVLLTRAPEPEVEHERIRFVERFQQVSGPAAAKGVEDTACYVWVPLAARNEVGGEPGALLDDAVERFHRVNGERAARWPAGMLAGSTHDTKRSADLRSRLAVLSEIPNEWTQFVRRWHRRHEPYRARSGRRLLPDANIEYLLYQTIVGIWEEGPVAPPKAALASRLDAYMLKAAREAKVRTSWVDPDEAFEQALSAFVAAVLSDDRFLDDLRLLGARIRRPGLWNALARCVLQFTAPGVPDTYQGDELWNFSLVDPDNRQSVDFSRRAAVLAELEGRFHDTAGRAELLKDLVRHPEDGRIKLHVSHRALAARRRHRGLFVGGDYEPLQVEGESARHVVAFMRRSAGTVALSIVPRLCLTLTGKADVAPIGAQWQNTRVLLPPSVGNEVLTCVFTSETVHIESTGNGRSVSLPEALSRFPVTLLMNAEIGAPA